MSNTQERHLWIKQKSPLNTEILTNNPRFQEFGTTFAVQCSHRLELSMKDACRDTYFDMISKILLWLYEKTPKRFHGLKALAAVMDEQVHKPARAQRTRWIKHKVEAASVLVSGYPVIITHLEKMSQDEPGKQASKISGYVKIMKSFKYVSCLLAFVDILVPIARLSVLVARR